MVFKGHGLGKNLIIDTLTPANMLTKDTVKTIHDDLQAAMAEVAKKHNLTMGRSLASYTAAGFKLTCDFGDRASTGGTDIDPALVRNLQRNGFLYGLTASDLNRPLKLGAKAFLFQGLRGRNAVVKEVATGKLWRYSADVIASALKA